MKSWKTVLAGVVLASWVCFAGLAFGQSASLLPNGQQVFLDSNGAPLAGGLVYMYVPNTTTPKATWQDSGESTPNSNPVVLNAAGRALIYGSGQYRQILTDSDGNTIWDQLTAASGVSSVGLEAPSQFGVAGSPVVSGGTLVLTWNDVTPNLVLAGPASGIPAAPTFRALTTADIPAVALGIPPGTMFDFAGTAPPSGYLLCDGSAVSRTTYSALFTAIGTTWGAGNGTTTFNLPNMQRRTAVGSGGSGTATLGNAVGNTGGEENHTLTIAEMPAHSHPVTDPGHTHTLTGVIQVGSGDDQVGGNTFDATFNGGSVDPAFTGISIQNTGGGGTHNVIQPSAVVLKMIKS